MKAVYSLLFFLGMFLQSSAQKVYFIYLQTENNTAFYVKLDDRIISSSNSGYLILSNLIDSTYQLWVGFPNQKSESRFSIKLSSTDKGYLIRMSGENMQLYDMQNASILKPIRDESQKNVSFRKRSDDFTYLLSKAANDPGLIMVPIVASQTLAVENSPLRKEQKAKDPLVLPVVANEPIIAKSDNSIKGSVPEPVLNATSDSADLVNNEKKNEPPPLIPEVKKDEVPQAIENSSEETNYKRSTVKKYSETSISEGFGLVFHDRYNGGTDTIRILIPNPKFVFQSSDARDSDQTSALPVNQPDSMEARQGTSGTPVQLKGCKAVANNNDFLKLRKVMAARTTDEGMVEEAKKYFQKTCFSTEQVKNLSALFLTTSGKYQFFDSAYLHVTDQQQFPTLQAELKDEYYLQRFKLLIGQ